MHSRLVVWTVCAVAAASPLSAQAAAATESFETAPVRPQGGAYVPPPYTPVTTEAGAVACLGRRYDLSGAAPMPTVGTRTLLRAGVVMVNGRALEPTRPTWTLKTPAVAIAERAWPHGSLRVAMRQTVEYDGFITCDLTLAPAGAAATISGLALRLEYRPDASVLYHIPVFRPTWAGFWPKRKEISKPIVGVWGGDDHAGFACYVATFRDWHTAGPRVVLSRDGDGPGVVEYRVVTEPTRLRGPVTYRFGFIATPVREPDPRHWQLFSLSSPEPKLERQTIWGAMSDHYPTFRTNKPDKHDYRVGLVKQIHGQGKTALAYTTYDHVEEGAVEVPAEWLLSSAKGKGISRSIGGAMGDLNRVFLCPGSRDWVEWKAKDIQFAIDQYGIDGLYVDTSYIIMPCANAAHGHGWLDAAGKRQIDYSTWSMRAIWRRSYELFCRARGKADIYAHHKGGCPAALAAFTSAFCDGEQFTSQSIKHMTMDAFRAQCNGRPMGPRGVFINEFYRSAVYGMRDRSQHHNPLEGLMLTLPHDTLPTGYPGLHPVRELMALRDDLGIASAEWTPYYAADAQWRPKGDHDVVASSYRTSRGDTVLVAANTGYEPASVSFVGPAREREGRTFVAIDVTARVGRSSPATPGYRWEPASPDSVEIAARSVGLFAFVRDPGTFAAFARQRGFVAREKRERKAPLPEGALLVSDFDDPDWVIVNDDGEVTATDREPVETRRALRVTPKPKHNAAALLKHYPTPPDWSGFAELTLWARPDEPMPVRAFQVRLRNSHRYGPALKLTSHELTYTLPAGRWTQLRYEFADAPRNVVQTLRIYYHRGELCSGAFDLDEVLLHKELAGGRGEAKRGEDPDAKEKPVPD